MAGGPEYTQEEADFLARRWVAGKTNQETYDEYVARFGQRRSLTAIKSARTKTPIIVEAVKRWEREVLGTRSERIERALGGEHVPGVTVGPRVSIDEPTKPEYFDPAREWERAKKATRAAKEWQTKRHYATVQIVTGRPVGIAFASDQHINTSAAVDMDRMEEDAKLIQATPGLFVMLGGDGVDNHIKHRSAMVNSGSRPSTEYMLYDHYLGMLGRSVLGMVSGNHDDWTSDVAGVDMVAKIAERHRVFYAPDFVVLTVQLVDPADCETITQEYKVKLRHQYRYNSSFNLGHAVKRMWEMDRDDFDIGVICHHHEAHFEPFEKHGLTRLAFRPGAYQITTGHSRRYGHKRAYPTCPTAVLWPDRRKMVPFKDVWDSATFLRHLRQMEDGGLGYNEDAA